MGTQTTPPAADLPRTHGVPIQGDRSQPARAGSLWFDLAIALVAGLLYALIVMGPTPLNPRNVDWVTVDPAYHYIGWELWRQDPHVHWPITYTDRLGYPKGESIALVDLNPLLAVLLRPFSPLLGEPFQYFGLEVVLACALQFFFAFRIFRLVLGTQCPGNGAVQRVLPAGAATELPPHAALLAVEPVAIAGCAVAIFSDTELAHPSQRELGWGVPAR